MANVAKGLDGRTSRIAPVRTPMDIERLISWALIDQGLGWVGRDAPVREDYADYGTVIDDDFTIGGMPSISLLTDDDASTVKAAIDALPGQMRRAVIQYGRVAQRPDWAEEGYGEPEQMRNKRGQLEWIYAVPGNRRSARTPRLDHWAHSRRREMVDFCRAEWTLWHTALIALVEALRGRMETHMATGPEAPAEPWALPAPAELSEAAKRRLERYRQRDEFEIDDAVVEGELTIDDKRAAAQAPITSVATDWGPSPDMVKVG